MHNLFFNSSVKFKHLRFKFCLLLIGTFLLAGTAYSQTKYSVQGKVFSAEDSQPIPGVTVMLKGTTLNASTAADGSFTIQTTEAKGILIISFLGMERKELPFSGNVKLNISLKSILNNLDEVVVGYRSAKVSEISTSISRVNVEELQLAPVRSFEEALAGRVAGVQVSSNDGQPGEPLNIIIRGASSVTQSNSPLYVVDGFPLENADNNSINPNDIEAITVLKDAAATAIYGSRGANGVILITTKTGKIGLPVISYTGFGGVQESLKFQKLMSPYEFVKYQFELDPGTTRGVYLRDGKTLESYQNVRGTDFQRQLIREAAFQNHSISLNGGTDKTRYALSASITDQDGLIINSGFSRQQGRFRIDQTVTDKLKIGLNANYAATKSFGVFVAQPNNTSPSQNLFYSVWGYRPVTGNDSEDQLLEELFDPQVDPTSDLRINPITNLKNTLRENFSESIFGNLVIDYKITKDLTLKISGGATLNDTESNSFNNSKTQGGSRYSASGVNGSVLNGNSKNFLNENTLSYNKQFSKNHKLNVVGGFTYQKSTRKSFGAAAILLPNEGLGISGLDEGTPRTVTSNSSQYSLASYLAAATYSYKSKYIIGAAFRSDGSSRFSPGNKWSYFPSGSVAWKIKSEDFMKNVKFINDAKLRTSFGYTGNNRVDDFAYQSGLLINSGSGYSFGNVAAIGINASALGNDNLKWETTAQFDAGIDLDFFKSRISLTVDYYKKSTSDLLLNARIPPSSGFSSAFINVGKVQNTGLEFTINTVNIKTPKFNWTSNFNISFNRNQLQELYSGQESIQNNVGWDSNYTGAAPYISLIGQPIASIYGYIWDGNYQYADFDLLPNGSYLLKANIPTNGSSRPSIQPGFIRYKDLNGDGVVNNFDRTVIGRPYPIHTGGFSNTFKYLGFDLNLFFQWSYGNDLFNANRIVFEGGNRRFNLNQFDSYKDRWSPTNQGSLMNAAGGSGPFVYSDRTIEDGSYLRLKTAAFGYNFNQKTTKKLGLKTLRAYVSGQNLLTWTNYSGLDPEVSTRDAVRTPGFDFSAYPRARTITFGLNVTL
ncbi:MAG: TonB-dependent receptor [Acinetobacter sp.]|nr:MAG: TonB-dependent receptor [Acinetobacter sp.]